MAGKADKDLYFAVWATAWGPMGAVAGQRGLRRIVLPHYQFRDLVDLLAWEHPAARREDEPFETFINLTGEYFGGLGTADFRRLECELPGEQSFSGKVYRACREISYGKTMSYSQLAGMIGQADSARAVAAALGRNPVPLVVPCHRVTYSDGRMGGFSAEGAEPLKRRMLDLERRICDRRGC
jgi:methylated-DNA-[protein]-cysteine S-methyltransferase